MIEVTIICYDEDANVPEEMRDQFTYPVKGKISHRIDAVYPSKDGKFTIIEMESGGAYKVTDSVDYIERCKENHQFKFLFN